MMASIAETQKKMLEGSDFVGDRFADEARAIHLGEADARSIHGQATKAQTDSLIEDGIKVAPLTLPVVEPSRAHCPAAQPVLTSHPDGPVAQPDRTTDSYYVVTDL